MARPSREWGPSRSGAEEARSRAEPLRALLNELSPGWMLPKGARVAQFNARMQELGRISVAEAERGVLGLRRGDIVQVLPWKAKLEGRR